MSRVAVFVDAGYLFAQGSQLLAGRRLRRGEISLDHDALVRFISEFASRISKADLLRIYWYDGTSGGPSAQHLTLAHLHDVKLRLGFVNTFGEQKGVDSLIVTDMIALARNHAISDAILLSGDEDLRVGVQLAQEFGVRVHLVGIKPARGSQSLLLLQESGTTHEWDEPEVRSFLACRPQEVEPAPTEQVPPVSGQTVTIVVNTPSKPDELVASVATQIDLLETVAERVAGQIDPANLPAVLEAIDSTRQLPQEIDRQLLTGGRSLLNRDLNPEEKRDIRAKLVASCRRRLGKA